MAVEFGTAVYRFARYDTIRLFDVESQIFVIMAKGQSMANISDTVKFVRPQRPTVWCDILHYVSFYKPSYSQFSLNIPKFTLLWKQGSV